MLNSWLASLSLQVSLPVSASITHSTELVLIFIGFSSQIDLMTVNIKPVSFPSLVGSSSVFNINFSFCSLYFFFFTKYKLGRKWLKEAAKMYLQLKQSKRFLCSFTILCCSWLFTWSPWFKLLETKTVLSVYEVQS